MQEFYTLELLVAALVLSSDLTGIYHYMGGLTTPGCNELVMWMVLDTPLLVQRNGLVSTNPKAS